ncbi:thioredoxin family protein, partial [bacterium]|nr:thioredoxin family protein [bacterium]
KGFLIFKKIIVIAAIILGTWFLKPNSTSAKEMAWRPYQEDIYSTAIKSGKPIIIDFYADWCIPCKEMDKITFTDPGVIKLSDQFNLLKVDLTSAASPEVIRLKDQFDIKGVPSILFIDKKGNEIFELRIPGFEKPELFLVKMNKTLSK